MEDRQPQNTAVDDYYSGGVNLQIHKSSDSDNGDDEEMISIKYLRGI